MSRKRCIESAEPGARAAHEIGAPREGVRRQVRDARGALDGDHVRHARLDEGLRGGLGEARGDEDELELRVAARLQQLAQLLHAHEVRRAPAVLHREVRRVAVARVVQPHAAAKRHERPQPVGRRVLEAHLRGEVARDEMARRLPGGGEAWRRTLSARLASPMLAQMSWRSLSKSKVSIGSTLPETAGDWARSQRGVPRES